MKSYVVYDSNFGNTKKIAESVAGGLKPFNGQAVAIADFRPEQLSAGDLLVVGSPINGWRPTPKIAALLSGLGNGKIKGVKAASFDTRLRSFIHGDAARKIAKRLKEAGADLIANPEPFYVQGTKGPLDNGELERASAWAKGLVEALKQKK